MGQFDKLFMNFAFVGLFILAMFTFVITTQLDNDSESKITDNSLIDKSFSNLSKTLGGYSTKAQAQSTLFETENPTTGFGTILLFSIVSAGKVFKEMIVGVFNVLIELPVVFLGVNAVVVSVIGSILLFISMFGLWRVYKLGS